MFQQSFNPDPSTGSGLTTITWTDLLDEEGETYAIYSAGALFNNTTSFGIEQVGSVPEGFSQFEYQVPIGRLGTSVYCVVVVDGNGIFDTYIPQVLVPLCTKMRFIIGLLSLQM